ncbi:hypothetical protein TrLO_g11991 [Triparma laevis f. longispina]|uniref:Uncharacterized protein n=1 Tax=Triparma laevis f. longispina TaxID=1714387 RepID=A0A9W7CAE6_9STRA|nr:hypothetical protein TrLO_g11991 [Triparma laevis f. longispina]
MPDVGNCVGDVATHFASGDFVGVVGKHEVFNICNLVNEHSHFNQGAGNGERKRRIYMFDYQGDCLIWMTGECTQQAETMKGRRAHVPASFGTMHNFSATVRLHEEYQGMKETKILRARVKVSWQSHPLVVVLKVSYCGQFSQ